MKRGSEGKMTMRDQMARSEETKYQSMYLDLPEGVECFKLDPEKKHVFLDLIPFKAGKDNPEADKGKNAYFRTFYTHRDIGPNKVTILCPAKNPLKGKYGECPCCNESRRLFDKANGDEDSKEYKMAVKLMAKKRNLFNVIDIEERDKGVQPWDISYHLFMKQLEEADGDLEEGDKRLQYAELKSGRTLKLKVKKKKFKKATYAEVTRVSFVKRKKKYKKSKMEDAYCLDDLLKKPMSTKELKNLFLQASSDSEEEDDDSSDNKRRKGKKMKTMKNNAKKKGIKKGVECDHDELGKVTVLSLNKKGTVATVEDEEEDEHDVGVGELEVAKKGKKGKAKAKPKKGKAKPKKGKKSKEEDDDDDDEEDDDEDDEEEEEEDDDEEDDDDDDDDDDEEDDD